MPEPNTLMIRSQIEKRAAALRREADALETLPADFITAIAEAQIEANKGWRAEGETLVDLRINWCPECGSPGMNTCWGFWGHVCGAGFDADGGQTEPCTVAKSAQST